MKRFIKQYIPAGYRLLARAKSIYRLLTDSNLTSARSYFPEMAEHRMPRTEIFRRQLRHIARYCYPNDFYFLYGLDIKGFRSDSDYVDYALFMNRRDTLNRTCPFSALAVLRNKFLFGLTARALNIPTPHNIGIVEHDRLYMMDRREYVDFKEYLSANKGDVFMKSTDGECADGVYHLTFGEGRITLDGREYDYDRLRTVTGTDKFILQEKIRQTKALSDLHPHSINTIRLETIYDRKTGRIEILPPLLRVGTGRHEVDNWAVGGLAIGIDPETKTLRKYGFYKPSHGTKAYRHPDTGIVFDGYVIPFLDEAIETAKRFHSYFTDIHSIGWDIAMTDEGPCFVEGNDNWEISLVQACSRGLESEFERLFY